MKCLTRRASDSSSLGILHGMTGFEHYSRELTDVDREIHHYAAACGVDLMDRGAVLAFLAEHHQANGQDRARDTLYGLLQLRQRIEIEMLESGLRAPDLLAAAGTNDRSLSDEENQVKSGKSGDQP